MAKKVLTEKEKAAKEAAKILLQNFDPKMIYDLTDITKVLVKEMTELMLFSEFDEHLGYEKHDQSPKATPNRRNGTYPRLLKTRSGEIEIQRPRDRDGTFDSVIVPKNKQDFSELEEKVISMYARGFSDRDIAETIEELFGLTISHETISNITDVCIERANAWRNRELKPYYPFVWIDALYADVKAEKGKKSEKVATYAAIGINSDGYKEVLGLWIRETEGAKEWLNIFEELKSRGVKKVTYLSADGLTGLEEAARAAFGDDLVYQRCIVHLIRNSCKFLPKKKLKEFCADLKKIYTAVNPKEASKALAELKKNWGNDYPQAVKVWDDNFRFVSQCVELPEEIRRIVYTTNTVESVNSVLRSATNGKGAFPNRDAMMKLMYLRLTKLTKKWNHVIAFWDKIKLQLDIKNPGWNGL
jgi:transposase-like protein